LRQASGVHRVLVTGLVVHFAYEIVQQMNKPRFEQLVGLFHQPQFRTDIREFYMHFIGVLPDALLHQDAHMLEVSGVQQCHGGGGESAV
jgi:hypothetical protein